MLCDYTIVLSNKQTGADMKKHSGTETKRIFQVHEYEIRLLVLSKYTKRQSDRNIPRSVSNSIASTLTGILGQDYVSLSLLTIEASPDIWDDISLKKHFSKFLWNGISLYRWFSSSAIPKEKMDSLS